ncbi:MAG: hypothetical protein HY744_05685 [Deltaproteobacteria bacterium]|nr:hypothetical protein [Deltaproteobacteria bacterium]
MGGPDKIEARLLELTREAGKSYGFDTAHDPNEPVGLFFQESDEGLVLFLVFYTRACRWSLCTGCPLPSTGSLHHVGLRALAKQIDAVFARPDVRARQGEIRKVIVSNQGSVLDEATFSSTALMYLVAQINLQLPQVAALSLETRAEYVDEPELEFLARAMAEGETRTVLEIAIGFEAFDEHIRNHRFRKGLSLAEFERLVDKVVRHDFHLKCYFMQKPVEQMSDEEAVRDIERAIDYLADLVERRGAHIGVHLNPTYAARGTPLGEAFLAGRYVPPQLLDVARAVRRARGKRLRVFVGLNDEGLAVAGGSFLRPGDERLVQELERFNRTGDFAILDAICTA